MLSSGGWVLMQYNSPEVGLSVAHSQPPLLGKPSDSHSLGHRLIQGQRLYPSSEVSPPLSAYLVLTATLQSTEPSRGWAAPAADANLH